MKIEYPTLCILISVYVLWAIALWLVAPWSGFLAVALCVLCIAQHSSLQHEVIHGHPFGKTGLNEASVWPALGLVIPFRRFRDTHLAHHTDANLTDPYDDPETNYLDPKVWDQMSLLMQWVLWFNNTLFGRMLVGPAIGTVSFVKSDVSHWNKSIGRAWIAHIPAALVVLGLVWISPLSIWAYLLACYMALSVLKIRTFLEHRAHEHHCARTVVVDDHGPLALLFLNNNYHVVHHMHPSVPWYELPGLYAAKSKRFLDVNDGYHYKNYAQVFRRYLFKAKDSVPHPLWRK